MNATSNQAQAIFLEAIALLPDQRADFLDRACSGDAELQARIGRLLHSHEQLGTFHDLQPDAAIDLPFAEMPGDTIGPYKLLRQAVVVAINKE